MVVCVTKDQGCDQELKGAIDQFYMSKISSIVMASLTTGVGFLKKIR